MRGDQEREHRLDLEERSDLMRQVMRVGPTCLLKFTKIPP